MHIDDKMLFLNLHQSEFYEKKAPAACGLEQVSMRPKKPVFNTRSTRKVIGLSDLR